MSQSFLLLRISVHVRKALRKLRYALEGALILALFFLCKHLSMDAASALGGFIASRIGPKLKVTRIAERNLTAAFPDYTPEKIHEIIYAMWENLGRTAAEFPHIYAMGPEEFVRRVKVTGTEHLSAAKSADKTGAIIFSGHLANWEVAPKVAFECGLPMSLVYRRANNPLVDNVIRSVRAKSHISMFPKGAAGAKKIVEALRQGKTIAMLVDQKMNDGIAVPFFGRDAMTAPAIAKLALKFHSPVIPARIVRTKGAYFEAHIFPPMELSGSSSSNEDSLRIMTEINQLLEGWIRDKPEQWLWLHKRWPG